MTEWRLLISIINFRTGPMTWDCVRSVLDDLGGRQDVLVVVVDNASGDGSADYLADRIAELPEDASPVRLVRSATNSGFSGGHNQGIAAGQAADYLILNSDAELRPGCIATLLAAADGAAPDIGILSPRIVDAAGHQEVSLFRFAGPLSEVIRGAATGPVTRILNRWDVPLFPPVAPEAVGWASFAAVVLRGRMLDQVGPLDEGYFMYFEDMDYCLRARRAGWHILPVPDAVVMHEQGGSGDVVEGQRQRKRLPAYFYASRTRFLTRAHGWHGYLAANLGWYLGRGVARLRRLAGKPVPQAQLREGRDIWLNATRPMGDRHAPS